MTSTRKNIDEFFMDMADLAASRSTCVRRKVGAVLTRNNKVLSTGYNGAPKKVSHCSETSCIRTVKNIPSGERLDLCFATHSEINAICSAAAAGTSTAGATLYCNTKPCLNCLKTIINAGIEKIVYRDDYSTNEIYDKIVNESGIILKKINSRPTPSFIQDAPVSIPSVAEAYNELNAIYKKIVSGETRITDEQLKCIEEFNSKLHNLRS